MLSFSGRAWNLNSRIGISGFRLLTLRKKTDLSRHGNVLGGHEISPSALKTFETWHKCLLLSTQGGAMSEGSLPIINNLADCVHKKCIFHPPTYFTPWTGRDEFLLLIQAVSEVFGKSFKYHRQWLSPDGKDWALEFTADIGDSGRKITGMDLVKLDENGQIIEFIVLARPPNAVKELKDAMMSKVPMRLAALKAKQTLSNVFDWKK